MAEMNFPEMIRDKVLSQEESERKGIIVDWVAQGQHEDLYLDFTEKKDPSKGNLDQDDKRGFAKALSGFANSDGGLLVWGVEAKKAHGHPQEADKARKPAPISELDVFVGELNAIAAYSTKPAVPGMQNVIIWDDQEAKRGWVISCIPAGPNPPYRAEQDNKNNFYKRAGSSFYPMEPFDIRDVVYRFRYPKIQIEMRHEEHHTELDTYWLIVEAHNAGPHALQEYKVQILMPKSTRWIDQGHSPTEVATPDGKALQWEVHSRRREPEISVIYPGERRILVGPGGLLHVRYGIDSRLHEAIHESPDRFMVTCRLHGIDMPPLETKRQMWQLESF